MSPAIIKFNIEWIPEQTDLSKCKMCEEVIYGTMYRLTLITNEKQEGKDIVLCQACKDLIK